LVRVYLSGNPVHDLVLKAFYEGCPEEKELVSDFDYKPSDMAVVFGVFKSRVKQSWPRGQVIQQQRNDKLGVIVLETGYVNRGDGKNHHYAAGFNGLNGRADFRNKKMPDDRWKKLGVVLEPYKGGDNILLCGQVPWDASVDHHDHLKWLKMAGSFLQKISERKVVFRPHPLAPIVPIYGCEYSQGKPLSEDLLNAYTVVTFNSNTGVDGLIAGKPVFAFDEGSMCGDLANRNMLYVDDPKRPSREQWAHDLAYTQWTPDEMGEGLAWSHLFRS